MSRKKNVKLLVMVTMKEATVATIPKHNATCNRRGDLNWAGFKAKQPQPSGSAHGTKYACLQS